MTDGYLAGRNVAIDWVLWCGAVSAMVLIAADITWAAPPTIAPRQIRLFEAGRGGYHMFRIPALAVTKSGTVLAFCEGRRRSSSDSGEIDLVLRRSADGGRTWEPLQVVVGDGENTCGNPCPIVDRRTGAVVLLFCKNAGSESQGQILRGEGAPRAVWVTRSADDGRTWSDPQEVSNQVREREWRWYATGPGHGIQLADGRLVAPCDHAAGPGDDAMHSHVILSDDGGHTWRAGGSVGERTDESTVAELSDGDLYLNMRSYRGAHRRAWSVSRDGGMTWSPVSDDPVLVEPVCQGSTLRLSAEGRHRENAVLFSNPASARRENLTVRLSRDDCKTWPAARMLWRGPAAYSDLAELPRGWAACLFECGERAPNERIVFTSFSVEWLAAGRDR